MTVQRVAQIFGWVFVLVAVWATVRHVPESKDPDAEHGFDHMGAVLAILAIGAGGVRGRGQSAAADRPVLHRQPAREVLGRVF